MICLVIVEQRKMTCLESWGRENDVVGDCGVEENDLYGVWSSGNDLPGGRGTEENDLFGSRGTEGNDLVGGRRSAGNDACRLRNRGENDTRGDHGTEENGSCVVRNRGKWPVWWGRGPGMDPVAPRFCNMHGRWSTLCRRKLALEFVGLGYLVP